MLPNFYQISIENFETNLNYFYATNNKIKHSYECLTKFKEYTSDYCSKLSQLFKKGNNFLEDYEVIDSDDILINNDDNSENKNNINQFFIFPIDRSIEILHNFFDELVLYMNDFVKNLENHIKGIEQYVTITKNEISSIKDDYEKQKNFFKSKFMEYQNLNNELKNQYYEGEKKLIDFCHKTRLNKISFEINYKLSYLDIVKIQNKIINKYNSLGNYEKEFLDITKEKINLIQDLTSTLFLKFESIPKNIPNIFNISVLSPMNKLIEEKVKINKDEDFESKLKKDFDFIINNYMNKIDENNIKLKLDEYNIKVLENNNIKINENSEDKKEKEKEKEKLKKKEKNHEKIQVNNPINEIIILTDEEIFFIVQNMYQEYKLINRNKYDLKIEEEKLKLKPVIKKLLNYSKKNSKIKNPFKTEENDTKNDENNPKEKEELTKEEIDTFCKEMSNQELRKYFLLQINNFRSSGSLEMPPKTFNYFIQIFSEISKQIFLIQGNDDKKHYKINDYISSRLIIIVAQTFYTMKDNAKLYISEELKNEKIFQTGEFWVELIRANIENECTNFFGKHRVIKNDDDEKRKNKLKDEIYFAQIIPFIGSMNGFGIDKEGIKNVIEELIKEFNISENTSKKIFATINDQN